MSIFSSRRNKFHLHQSWPSGTSRLRGKLSARESGVNEIQTTYAKQLEFGKRRNRIFLAEEIIVPMGANIRRKT
jgi:hypothetical protein